MKKFFTTLYLFFPIAVLALTTDSSLEGTEIPIDAPKNIFESLLQWFVIIAGVFSVAGVIYAGMMYATTGGNEEKAKKAKAMLLWSIVGGVVIVLSYGILMFTVNFVSTGNLPVPTF